MVGPGLRERGVGVVQVGGSQDGEGHEGGYEDQGWGFDENAQ